MIRFMPDCLNIQGISLEVTLYNLKNACQQKPLPDLVEASSINSRIIKISTGVPFSSKCSGIVGI